MRNVSVIKKTKPLNISCTSSDCESHLHCFNPTKEMKALGQTGSCRKCGIDLFDWNRVHSCDKEDAEYVFQCLKQEYFRHHMWHVDIDIKAINYARRKGKIGIKNTAEHRIRKYLAEANPPFDGRQTPREGSGNAICNAQHATATCCRKCAEYWYDIPQDRVLSEQEITFFVELIVRYIDDRLSYLKPDGEKVPPLRNVDV